MPTGTPTTSATSARGRPAWWCRTKTARCSGVSRRNARSSASRSSTETIGVGSARSVDRQDPDARYPSPVPSQLLVTGIDEQPIEPRREALRIAEPRELAPGEEECLLDGVLCPLRIPQDPVRDRVAEVAVEVDQLREGDVVALACPFDQPRPHWRYSSGARMGASPTNRWSHAANRFNRGSLPAGTGPRGSAGPGRPRHSHAAVGRTMARMDRPRRRRARIALPARPARRLPADRRAAVDAPRPTPIVTASRTPGSATCSLTSPSRVDTDRRRPLGRAREPRPRRADQPAGIPRQDQPRRADTDRDGFATAARTATATACGPPSSSWPARRRASRQRRRRNARRRESPDRDSLMNISEQRRHAPASRRHRPRRLADGADTTPGRPAQRLQPPDRRPCRHRRPRRRRRPTPTPTPTPRRPAARRPLPGAPNCPVFPATNVWNVRDRRPRRSPPNSATMINDDRSRPRPAHGLRVVRRLRHPVPSRDVVDAALDRHLRLRRRVRPRRLSDPGQPARSRAARTATS